MTRHTPRWQLMQPWEENKKKEREREKSSSCRVCAVGIEPWPFLIAVTSRQSGLCLWGFKTAENVLSHTPMSETRKTFKIINKTDFYPRLQILYRNRWHFCFTAALLNQSNQFTFLLKFSLRWSVSDMTDTMRFSWSIWSMTLSEALNLDWIQWSDSRENSLILFGGDF